MQRNPLLYILTCVIITLCALPTPAQDAPLLTDADIAQMERDLRDAIDARRADAYRRHLAGEPGATEEWKAWVARERLLALAVSQREFQDEALADAPPTPSVVDPPAPDPDPPAPAPADAREVRVAPGDDLDAAIAQLRDGYPDRLLFERGGVYDLPADRSGALRYWRLSGRSADEPAVIGAYGPADLPRPVLRSNGNHGFRSIRASHLVIRDLHLLANQRTDGRNADKIELGMVINEGDDIRVVNVVIEAFKNNVDLDAWPRPSVGQHDITNIVFDGCTIIDAHSRHGVHSQGLYAKQVRGLTITGCVFDHNGWSDAESRTGFNHNVYLSMCDEVRITGSVLSRGSNMGVKLRSDYEGAMHDVLIAGNLFTGNLTGITASSDPKGEENTLTISGLVIRGNVFTDHGGDLPNGNELGHAVTMQQADDVTIRDNLLIDLGHAINREAFNVSGSKPNGMILIERNVLERWPMARGREVLTSDSDHDGLTLRGNLVERGVASRRPADYAGPLVGMVPWLFEGISTPTTLYTHHPALLAAYPGAFTRSEVLVNIDFDLPDRQTPKLERAAASRGLALVDYEPLPRRAHVVDEYLGIVTPAIARIRVEYPDARIALYQHCGRDDGLHTEGLDTDAAEQRRANMAATLAALDMASLDIDAITPVCYQPRQPELLNVGVWLGPMLEVAQATGHNVVPIIWTHTLAPDGSAVLCDLHYLRAICEGLRAAGITEVMVWFHDKADPTEPGVAERIAVIMEVFGR